MGTDNSKRTRMRKLGAAIVDGHTQRRFRLAVALLALVLLVAWTTRDALGSLLEGMQPDDRTAVSASVFRPSPEMPGTHAERVVDAIGRWHDFFAGVPATYISPNGVVRIHALVGILFGLALAGLLSLAFLKLKRRMESASNDNGLAIKVGRTATPLLAIAHLVDGLVVWRVTDHVWRTLENEPEAEQLVSDTSAFVLWAAGVAKLALLLVVLAMVVIALVELGAGRSRQRAALLRRSWPFLRALRAPLLVVGLLGLLMSLPQVGDVVRGWDGQLAFFGLLFLAVLAAALRLSGTLLARVASRPGPERSPGWAGGLVVALFVVQLLLYHAVDGGFGFGLVVPAGIVGGVWALGGFGGLAAAFARLREAVGAKAADADANADGTERPQVAAPPIVPGLYVAAENVRLALVKRWQRIARAIGAVAVVIVGVGILRAATGPLVYPQRGDASLLLLAVPGVYLAAFWRTDEDRRSGWHLAHVAGTLTSVAGLLVLLAVGTRSLSAAALYAAGVLTVFAALPVYFGPRVPNWLFRRAFHPDTRGLLGGLTVIVAVVGAVGVWQYAVDPVQRAPQAGSAAIILSLLTVTAIVLFGLVYATETVRPARLFRRLAFARTPVLTLLVLWVIVASAVGHRDHHDVRVLESDRSYAAIPIWQAFDNWSDRNLPHAAVEAIEELNTGTVRRRAVPLVLVSTSGGGIRAAVWTAHVLNCIFEGDEPPIVEEELERRPCEQFGNNELPDGVWASDRLMVASGVSGGALGLASYTAYITAKEADRAEDEGWVRARLGDDYLAAPLSQSLLVDTPQLLLGFSHDDLADSAEMLELAWEASWADGDGGRSWLERGLFASYHESDHVPVVVANGSSVAEGCRFNASVLEANTEGVVEDPNDNGALRLEPVACTSPVFFESTPPTESGILEDRELLRLQAIGQATLPAAWDLGDFLCEEAGHDIRLSTMALLSARFPFISPSGRLDRAKLQVDGCVDNGQSVVHVVDGGYVDSSGTLTLRDLWDDLQPLVQKHNDRAMADAPPDPDGPRVLEPCIVPFMLHIDNGYDSPPIIERAGRPWELLVPLTTLSTSRSGHVANARASAALEFEEPLSAAGAAMKVLLPAEGKAEAMVSRYARLTTRAHPGVQAPLGWTLSDESIDDLGRELVTAPNIAHLDEVAKWFSESLVCEVRHNPGVVAVPDSDAMGEPDA